MSFVSVKARFNGEVHRFTVNSENVEFNSFQRSLASLFFDNSLPKSLSIKYQDEDGDNVTIATDLDLIEAVRQVASVSDPRERVLRLELTVTERVYPDVPASGEPLLKEPPRASVVSDDIDYEFVPVPSAPPAQVPAPAAAAAEAPAPKSAPPPASAPSAPAAEDQEASTFIFHALDKLIENPSILSIVNAPFVPQGLLARIIPSMLSSRLESSPELAALLNSRKFLDQYLPALLERVLPTVPRLVPILGSGELDAVLTVFAPEAAAVLRSFLSLNADKFPARQEQPETPFPFGGGAGGIEALLPMFERMFSGAASGPAQAPQAAPEQQQQEYQSQRGGCCGGQGGVDFASLLGTFAPLLAGGFGGPGACGGQRRCGPAWRGFHHQQQQQQDDSSSESSDDDAEETVAPAAAATEGPAVHDGVSCDACGAVPIRGTRYKCTVCFNFDLCDGCQQAGRHPASHPMLLMREPVQRPKRRMHGHGHGHGPFRPSPFAEHPHQGGYHGHPHGPHGHPHGVPPFARGPFGYPHGPHNYPYPPPQQPQQQQQEQRPQTPQSQSAPQVPRAGTPTSQTQAPQPQVQPQQYPQYPRQTQDQPQPQPQYYPQYPRQTQDELAPAIEEKLRQLAEMGFPDRRSNLAALARSGGSVDRAVALLLGA